MATVVSFSRLLPKPQPPLSRSAHRPLRFPSPPLYFNRLRLPHRLISISSAVQENGGGASETTDEEAKDEEASSTKVAEELKAMMAARKEKEKEASADLLIGGVAEEIREIEWPAFGKVVGTTGVVLAVIAGSSVVLLTVNAILAELSDRVFAGRGLQDFF